MIDKITHQKVMREFSYDPITAMGGREKCTVGALRALARHVDVTTRANLGGLKTASMDQTGTDRRPVTSGDIRRMLPA